jgi:hypothetical protein
MRKKRIAISSLAVLMSGGAAPVYTISGTVYDADGSTPVEGATVALGALSAVSAANGTYTIADVPPGASGSMTCAKAGYSWTAITVAAMSGSLTSQNYTNAWWAGGGSSAGNIRAYQPIGAASLAASYVNLKNPGTGNAAPGTAPTWDATNGWKFAAASSQYLNTGARALIANNSMFIRFSNVSTGDISSIASGTYLRAYVAAGSLWYFGQGDQQSIATAATAGVLAVVGPSGFKDGVKQGITLTNALVPTGLDILIGCMNNGAPTAFNNVYIQAWALYNVTVSDAQAAMISTAMANLT